MDDESILEITFSNLKCYTLVYFIHGLQQNMICVIKGLGLQQNVQMFSVFNLLITATVSAYLFACVLNFGINGLWYGELIGFTFNLAGCSYIVFNADWSAISKKCQEEQELQLQSLKEDDETYKNGSAIAANDREECDDCCQIYKSVVLTRRMQMQNAKANEDIDQMLWLFDDDVELMMLS